MTELLRPFVRTLSLSLLFIFLSHISIPFAQAIIQAKQDSYDPSAIYGPNALIILEALKQLSASSHTGNHIPGLEEKDGVPYIPFLEKSQEEIVMLEKGKAGGSGEFSLTKFMKEKLDPELASLITEEVEQQILLTIHQKAETGAISCEGATNENLRTICAMCKAEKAYLLTEDNWFAVGLDNQYKDEFAAIMYYAQYFVPTTRWLATFSEHNICLGSVDRTENMDLNNMLKYVTSKDFCYYTKFGIVPLQSHGNLDFAGFVYYPIGSNMSYITDLVMKYEVNHFVPITDDVNLTFSSGWIRSKEIKHIYLGTSHITTHNLPFSMEVSKEQDYYYAESNVAPYFITGSDVLGTLGVHQTTLFTVLNTDKGLSDLGSFTVSEIAFKFSRETISAVGIVLNLFQKVLFAVTPEFSFKELHTTIDVDITEDHGLKASSKLILEGTVVDSINKTILNSVATKTENYSDLTLSQREDVPALKITELEDIFKAQDPSFKGFLSSEKNFDRLRGYYLVDLNIKVGQGPVPSYFITANLSEGTPMYRTTDCQYVEPPTKIGELQAAVAFIGGKLNTRTVLTFPQRGLDQLVLNGTNHTLIAENLDLQGFTLAYNNHDLDTGLYPTVFALYQGDRYWARGSQFEWDFIIKACNETAFCNIFNSLISSPRTKNVLKGTIENERIVLQSQVIQNNTALPGMNLTDITLNMGFTLNEPLAAVDTYLTFWTGLPLPNKDPLMLKGTISFNSTHAILVAKSNQVWENALNLKSLQISQLKINGLVNPRSSDIEDIRAEGIAIWGTECFTAANGTNKTVFDKERCFFGKNDINVNVKDIAKSHITGLYKDIKTSHIIHLSEHVESENDVPKQFMNLKFTDYVEIKYIPPKVQPTVLLEVEKAERLEAGLFIKGASQLNGFQGTTILKMKSDGTKLDGTFSFGNAEIIFGNVLIEGSEDGDEENLNTIELSLLGESKSLTMETKLSIVGLQGTAKWTYLDNSTSFEGKVVSDLFDEITVKGTTNDTGDMKTAKIALNGEVDSDLTDLNDELRDSLSGWARGIQKIIDKNQENVDYLKQITEEKEQELCKEDQCEYVQQCLSPPDRKCVKYAPQEVCLDPKQQCQNSELICKDQQSEIVGDSSYSNGTVTVLEAHSADICKKLEYQCKGDLKDVCDNAKIEDDESRCESYGWTCEEGTVMNFGCKSECERRVRVHKKIQTVYQDTQAKIDGLKDKIKGLESFLNNTGKGSDIQITKMSFEVMADKLITQSDFLWTVTYKLGDIEHSVSLKGLNLVDLEETVDSILAEIGKKEGQLAGFEWKGLEEYNAYLNQEMRGNTPVAIFLELGGKKSSPNTQIEDRVIGAMVN